MKQGDSVRSVVSSVYPPQCSVPYFLWFSVYHNNHWCRAVIDRFSSEDKPHLRLRLVDLGMFVEAPVGDVTNLPDQFLKEAGMAIWCHLESIILAEDLQSSILSHVLQEVAVWC